MKACGRGNIPDSGLQRRQAPLQGGHERPAAEPHRGGGALSTRQDQFGGGGGGAQGHQKTDPPYDQQVNWMLVFVSFFVLCVVYCVSCFVFMLLARDLSVLIDENISHI
jgi:hypothetical protein